jgi:hypothetical protein
MKKIKYFFQGVMRESMVIVLFLAPLFAYVVDVRRYVFDVWGIRLQWWLVLPICFFAVIVLLFLVCLLVGVMAIVSIGLAKSFHFLKKVIVPQRRENSR